MEKKIDLPPVLSVKDVQTYLNLSQSTAYRLFKDDKFPSFKIGGSKRISKDDFLDWVNNQK